MALACVGFCLVAASPGFWGGGLSTEPVPADQQSMQAVEEMRSPTPFEPSAIQLARTRTVLAPRAREQDKAPEDTHIWGRCLDASGKPAADCDLEFEIRERGSPKKRYAVRSETDGRFRLELAHGHPAQVHAKATRAGCAPQRGFLRSVKPGARVDLGDISFPDASLVEGRAVDAHGRGLPHLTVTLRRVQRMDNSPIVHSSSSSSARTDSAGRFRFRLPIDHGTWSVHLKEPTHEILGPKQIQISDARGAALLVQAAPRPHRRIDGYIRRGSAGVGGILLAATGTKGSRLGLTSTFEDGYFAVFPSRAAHLDQEIELRLDASQARESELVGLEQSYAWDRHDLTLSLEPVRKGSLTIWPQDHEGKPFSGCHLTCVLDPVAHRQPWAGKHFRPRASKSGERGSLLVEDLRAGVYLVRVFSSGSCSSAYKRIVVARGEAAQATVTVAMPRNLRVRVENANGVPVPDARVRFVHRLGRGPFAAAGPVVTRADPDAVLSRAGFVNLLLEEDHAKTGPSGTATLRRPATGPGSIHVSHEDYQPILVEADTASSQIVVRFAGQGQISGTFTGLAAMRATQRGRALRVAAVRGRLRIPREGVPVGEAGDFSISGIPDGDWYLEFRAHSFSSDGSGVPYWTRVADTPIRCSGGQQDAGTFDLKAQTPGTLTGSVSLLGAACQGVLEFEDADADPQKDPDAAILGRVTTRAGGQFEWRSARPGTYRVWLKAGGRSRLRCAEQVVVRPGVTTDLPLSFRPAK